MWDRDLLLQGACLLISTLLLLAASEFKSLTRLCTGVYAGLFFSVGIDVSDNELAALEAIHRVCRDLGPLTSAMSASWDLVFNFHKVCLAVARSQTALDFTLGAEQIVFVQFLSVMNHNCSSALLPQSFLLTLTPPRHHRLIGPRLTSVTCSAK